MSKIARIGINGFGRIGRLAFRASFSSAKNEGKIMAINDRKPNEYLAYLLKFDSSHGRFDHKIEYND